MKIEISLGRKQKTFVLLLRLSVRVCMYVLCGRVCVFVLSNVLWVASRRKNMDETNVQIRCCVYSVAYIARIVQSQCM